MSSPVTLLGSVLGVWVAPAVSFSPGAPRTSSHLSRKVRGLARTSLRLDPRENERQQQQQEEEAGIEDAPASSTSASDFRDFDRTSSPVKAFVGGLTDLFVRFSGQDLDQDSLPPVAPKVSEQILCAGFRVSFCWLRLPRKVDILFWEAVPLDCMLRTTAVHV